LLITHILSVNPHHSSKRNGTGAAWHLFRTTKTIKPCFRLFLAESITVSAFGSLVGLLLGAGFAMAAIPIIRFFADVPFSAVLTWNTFFIIASVAILIGMIFGTYPAIKAAKLDPVEALRRE
jgi:ABC-type antimicrobial peptide transport system permease subunit